MQIIESTLTQKVSTIHPDLIIEVPFKYNAKVHSDGYEVDVIEVYTMDGDTAIRLSVNKNIFSIDRFLAHIREDARAKAYQLSKAKIHV